MIALSMLLAAAPACSVTKLTPSERVADSVATSRILDDSVRPRDISDVTTNGRWKLVWATPKDAERSVVFLHLDEKGRWQNAGVWGGVMAPEDRPDTVAWVMDRGRGFPAALGKCFVDALAAGK